jgi:hypothetical protein
MINKRVKMMWVGVMGLLWAGLFFIPALAQEGDGYRETFDNPPLIEWEVAPGALVENGVLKLNPGNFALRFGDWSDITLNIKVKYTGDGQVGIGYYFRDEGSYNLLISDNFLSLEKVKNGVSSQLGQADVPDIRQNLWINLKIVVSGGEHEVYVDETLQLSATDAEPLPTGAVLLHVLGDATAEFDDLEVRGVGGPPPQELEGAPPEPELFEPAPLAAGEQPAGAAPAEQAPGFEGLIEEFFASQANNVELTTFVINLILAAICAYILSLVYMYWGSSLSNRRKFASNFMLMSITTTFIILVVRSSVALSLGLVGALSIVRFRTAIKEPEELAYLFFAIGLGIGLGDNQRLITLLALVAGIIIIGLSKLFRRTQADVNLHLEVASRIPHKIEPEQIMSALQAHTSKLKLLRFDENPESVEASFLVEFGRLSNMNNARAALKTLSDQVEITFLDNKGIW